MGSNVPTLFIMSPKAIGSSTLQDLVAVLEDARIPDLRPSRLTFIFGLP